MSSKRNLKEFFRALKFTLVSISAGIIQIGSFSLLLEVFELKYLISYIVSLTLSVLWNFTINRKITFKAANNVAKAMLLVFAFYVVFAPLSMYLGNLAVENGANEYLVEGITMATNLILEFIYTRLVVYRNSCDTAVKSKKPLGFRMLEKIIKLFFGKTEFIDIDKIPNESCFIIANHSQLYSPIACQLDFPGKKVIWATGEVTNTKDFPKYAQTVFWGNKPKITRWFYKILSYVLAPIFAYVMGNADILPVYRDARMLSTFKYTVETICNGTNVVIFPESPQEFNQIVNEFNDKFVDAARFYYTKYKKELYFVPMYNAAKLKKARFGNPIKYDSTIPIEEQRKIICDYLKKEITLLGESFPLHKVVPFNNINKKDYKNNK